MPTIPLYYHNQSGAGQARGVRLPANLMGASEAVGAELRATVDGLKRSLQEARDYRAHTEAKLARDEAWGQFESSLSERGEEDKWAGEWAKRVQGVQKQFLSGAAVRGMSPEARRTLEFEHRAWEQSTRLKTQHLATQRGIEVARQVASAAADASWERGDEEAAVATYNEMVDKRLLDAQLVPQLVERGRARMQRVAVERETNAALELPPIHAIEAFNAIAERLDTKTEGTEAMSDAERLSYLSHTEKLRRGAQGAVASNGQGFINRAIKGEDVTQAILEAVQAGHIDEELARAISPRAALALAQYTQAQEEKAEAKAAREEERTRNKQSAQQARADALQGKLEKGKAGEKHFARQLELGKITQEQHDELLAEYQTRAEYEKLTPEGAYATLEGEIAELTARSMRKLWLRRDAPEAEFAAVLAGINTSTLTEASKLDLLDKWMAAKVLDLESNGEEAVEGQWADRKVSKPEHRAIEALQGLIQVNAPQLGSLRAGRAFWVERKKIREFFDTGKPIAELPELMAGIERELNTQAAEALTQEALGDLF